MREEDVPAEQPEAQEDPWVPAPDAHPRRPRADRAPPRQGPRPPVGLIWRVRDRAAFEMLARGRRRRIGVLEMRTAVVGTPTEPPRVAFAVPRAVGNAVRRNRVRRRLRAAVRDASAGLHPGHGYLIRAAPGSADVTYRELAGAVRDLVDAAREESR